MNAPLSVDDATHEVRAAQRLGRFAKLCMSLGVRMLDMLQHLPSADRFGREYRRCCERSMQERRRDDAWIWRKAQAVTSLAAEVELERRARPRTLSVLRVSTSASGSRGAGHQ